MEGATAERIAEMTTTNAARANLIRGMIVAAALTLSAGTFAEETEPVSRTGADFTVRDITAALFKAKPGETPDYSNHDLTYLDLSGLNFKGAKLAKSNLYGVDFTGANLRGTDMAGTRLDRATLIRADFSGANLADTDLSRADFTGADLTDANLTGADLDGATLLAVKGLETVKGLATALNFDKTIR